MPVPTPADKRALTGSNVRRKARAAKQQQIEQSAAEAQSAQRKHSAPLRRLVSKADRRTAARLRSAVLRDLQMQNLKSGSDAKAWARNARRARKRLAGELARAIPSYRRWQQALLRTPAPGPLQPGAIALAPALGVTGGTGSVDPVNRGAEQLYTPPFDAYDTGAVKCFDTSVDVVDQSFALPSIGQFVNDVDFTFSDDGHGILDSFASYDAWAACGISYVVPSPGHLKISARLRNFHNRVLLTAQDQFGYSKASLNFNVGLYIDIVSANGDIEAAGRWILHDSILEHGDDIAYVLPTLDTESPYYLQTTSQKLYGTNRAVQILAGCLVSSRSNINDMTTHSRSLFWWGLEELSVEVEKVFVP